MNPMASRILSTAAPDRSHRPIRSSNVCKRGIVQRCVVFANPVMTRHYTMLQRNLLYTGVTRGKKLVVLVGQKKAVAIAVRSISGRRRWSKLREWLAEPNG